MTPYMTSSVNNISIVTFNDRNNTQVVFSNHCYSDAEIRILALRKVQEEYGNIPGLDVVSVEDRYLTAH